MVDNRLTIKVLPKTKKMLKEIGFFGETYDDIIQRLIKRQTKINKKEDKAKYVSKID